MRVASTLVAIFIVPVLLVALTRGEGRSYCHMVLGLSNVLIRKDNNVVCQWRKWHMKCAGLCDSKSTVSVKDGAVHWNQDCECCQPVGGHQFRLLNLSMPCNDSSRESVQVRFVAPTRCQCIDC